MNKQSKKIKEMDDILKSCTLPQRGIKIFSIIIVTHNNEKTLLKCLDSVEKAFRNFSYETIVVDNMSTDGTRNLLGDLHNIISIESQNNGFSAGCNIGAAAAEGNLLLFMNPDAYIYSLSPQRILDERTTNPSIIISAPIILDTLLKPSGNARSYLNGTLLFAIVFRLYPLLLRLNFIKPYKYSIDSIAATHFCDWVSGCFMIIPRLKYMDLGGLCTDYFMFYEDIDLCKRAFSKYKVPCFIHISDYVVHIGGHSSSRYGAKKWYIEIESRIRYFSKFHWATEEWLVRIISLFQMFTFFLKLFFSFKPKESFKYLKICWRCLQRAK